MTVTLNLSAEQEEAVRATFGDNLSRAMLEALVIEAYRRGDISIGMVAPMLGLPSRWDAEAWLGERGVHWNYSVEEFKKDCATSDRLRLKGAL